MAKLLGNFADENWDEFSEYESQYGELLDSTIRRLNPEVHSAIRNGLMKFLPDIVGDLRKVTLVVDSNIIVKDAFRVGKGKPSSTAHLLSSPYIEVFAPPELEVEVDRNIRHDLPAGCSLDIAKSHAKELIAKLNKASATTVTAIDQARMLLSPKAPEDVPFLALAIEKGADAVVSGDIRAFGNLPNTRRFQLKDTAQLVLTYESGSMSLILIGGSSKALFDVAKFVVVAVIQAIMEIMEAIAGFLVAFASGSAEELEKVPEWAWLLLGLSVVSILLALTFSEKIRNSATETLSRVIERLNGMLESAIGSLSILWAALKSIIVWIVELLAPLAEPALIVFALLMKRIKEFMAQIESLSGTTGDSGVRIR